MRIGINATHLEIKKRYGVGRYLANILKEWVRDFPNNEYYLYFKKEIPEDEFLDSPCCQKIIVRCPSFMSRISIWENIFLPRALASHNLDIFFSPGYTLPLRLRVKSKVVHVYDISYIAHPEWYALPRRWIYNFLTPFTLRGANIITAGSEFSKGEIISYFKIPEEKVKVVYSAAEEKFRPIPDKDLVAERLEKYKIKRPYILYVGQIINRRNVPALLKAFKKFLDKTRVDYNLVLLGVNRTYNPSFKVEELVNSLGIEKKVVHLEYIPEEDMVFLYNGAKVFIYPSSYEGFGIPPLEALSCGIPVITSNLTSLPEVVGEVAYLLKNPTDINEVAEALEKVALDNNLCQEMAVKGLARAKVFSWQKCAKENMEIFNQSLNFLTKDASKNH